LAVTDTTLRDAHQSLLATRMRTYDMLTVAPYLAHLLPQAFSLEVWGGATFDVALRFLHEDPWERLAQLREAVPNICLQMLLRGNNAVGYTGYPPVMVQAFVAEAHQTGVDLFRIFDALNDVEQMRPAIEATLEVGALAEGTLCYTADLLDPDERVYTLDHYLGVAEGLIAAGVHLLCIKDMAGLLRAPAARTLVTALRERFDVPVHLHTHDTTGGQLGTYVAAIEAGVDIVDAAAAPLSGMTSQPNISAVVGATDHTDRATGLDLSALADLEPYWEAVRTLYTPFEAGLRSPTGTVYRHEIPGGQLSNLRQQAVALGLGDRFEEVERYYRQCNRILGNPIKVTPTSKVVGDLALYLVSSGVEPETFEADPTSYDMPASVIGYLRGELGTPPGGWPEPLRSQVLADGVDQASDPELSTRDGAALQGEARRSTLNHLLFPGPAADQIEMRERYGDVSVLPTRAFFYGLEHDREIQIQLEPGVILYVQVEAIGDPDEQGLRTVLVSLNGQTRPMDVRDRSIEAVVAKQEKADPSMPGHISAPLTGVVTVLVAKGDAVTAGDKLAAIEAMKMESAVSAPFGGRIDRVVVNSGTAVEPGDLVLVINREG
jgi:pyruvate carboxylase